MRHIFHLRNSLIKANPNYMYGYTSMLGKTQKISSLSFSFFFCLSVSLSLSLSVYPRMLGASLGEICQVVLDLKKTEIFHFRLLDYHLFLDKDMYLY